jgi:hypothetical protein
MQIPSNLDQPFPAMAERRAGNTSVRINKKLKTKS